MLVKNKNGSFHSFALYLLRRVESGNRGKCSKGIRADPKAYQKDLYWNEAD